MNLHDQYYRKLFSCPGMVSALFDGILPRAWRELVDIATLEPLPSDYVSGRQRDRRGDRVWRVRRRDGRTLYLLILLEHQSSPDRIMSIRVLGYSALLYEDVVMRRLVGPDERLPVLLPIVLYTGEARWRMPVQVSDLLDLPPKGLQAYQPRMRYLLLDAGMLVASGGLPKDNLAALLFRLEHNQGIEQVRELLQTVLRLTRRAEHRELRHAFGSWVRHVLFARSLPQTIHLPDVDDLQEMSTMLTTHSRDWSYQWKQEGRQEGAATLLERQLVRKFGRLPEETSQRIRQASPSQLEAWSLNLLDATLLEDVFQDTDQRG